jgi:hypothetical protein
MGDYFREYRWEIFSTNAQGNARSYGGGIIEQ